jgi:hypothetical protein
MKLMTALAIALLFATHAGAGAQKKLVGTYRLVERVSKDGATRKRPPEVLGTLTFSKTQRSLIMKWENADGSPVSIAVIASYTMDGGKYCETAEYGVQSNLGAPGVAYDTPATLPSCTAAISDATGLSFEIPVEKLRFHVTRDGLRVITARWTDHWEKVK